ncbi:DSBA oxidoreductase [Emticicia oligotrophica DSM 17448]|uniref:DSBA oxidoreductase n=1 Tax=Emticicia oligotrophica (strain DSM 17448 / CIP 109782 / MTCC 6937 / GPTSA100-15) TaxID=929562 RepID=A0ABN4AQ72_EMTOG|nr:ClpXP adapter SpxH family protein [Emticicia oligotrophica]AFK04499.1 DSBA oxidoreductase [Emticicia oligotrophica DSM 17448]
MTNNNNPLLCDPEEGICEIQSYGTSESIHFTETQKPLKIIYFTDPICSTCWGIEPQLRRLKLEYAPIVEFDYRMGGLLPDWNYNKNGISKPSDVAHHWDEVSTYYKMPIDGNVWIEDPLHSSYPPSIAFKAAQIQNEELAIKFLRKIREMVFLEKKNITKWEHIKNAAIATGLDENQLKSDYEFKAKELFKADLELARKMGVRGFPTLFFVGPNNINEIVVGFKPYANFENAIARVFKDAYKIPYDKSCEGIFAKYSTLTSREFSELSGVSNIEGEEILNNAHQKGLLNKTNIKNGILWVKK